MTPAIALQFLDSVLMSVAASRGQHAEILKALQVVSDALPKEEAK